MWLPVPEFLKKMAKEPQMVANASGRRAAERFHPHTIVLPHRSRKPEPIAGEWLGARVRIFDLSWPCLRQSTTDGKIKNALTFPLFQYKILHNNIPQKNGNRNEADVWDIASCVEALQLLKIS
ncbi:hypothetical protein HFO94_25160 [Rhizobium leguminosarum]|uniref:hypothetical protein n=1 Tax=Rhizobium leguminosarum TaxID=384 RepID=UPI001C94F7D2|nr:hypothetical protein [Rhizobium leguminosarum]MBY5356772.1 hypothetical protein [Rhizobium leguminosarum]